MQCRQNLQCIIYSLCNSKQLLLKFNLESCLILRVFCIILNQICSFLIIIENCLNLPNINHLSHKFRSLATDLSLLNLDLDLIMFWLSRSYWLVMLVLLFLTIKQNLSFKKVIGKIFPPLQAGIHQCFVILCVHRSILYPDKYYIENFTSFPPGSTRGAPKK